ncbi:MAG: hypothetical protein K2Q09_02180, partial [Phycisphaerales bacterium]|nr:hypothetical protein [Phycisphaerales bacterium]
MGTVDTNYRRWELRGVAGPIGVHFWGRTVRTEAEPLDRAQLLRAARRLAESNPEPQGLMARAWASEGPSLLFEPAPGWPLAAGAPHAQEPAAATPR